MKYKQQKFPFRHFACVGVYLIRLSVCTWVDLFAVLFVQVTWG